MGYWGDSKPAGGVVPNLSHPLASGLAAAYLFNTGGGLAADTTGRSGSALAGNGPIWTPNRGGAFTFTKASTQYFNLTSRVSLANRPFTVSVGWIATAATLADSDLTLFSAGSAQANDALLHIKVRPSFTSVGYRYGMWFDDLDGPNTTFVAGQLYRVTITMDATHSQVLYAEGSQVGSRTAASFYVGTDVWNIGRRGGATPDEYLSGTIIDLFVWSGRALSPSEVARHAERPYTLFHSPVWRRYFVPQTAVTVAATGIPSQEKPGVSVVTPGAVSISAKAIPPSEQLGVAAVSSNYTITATGIPSSERTGVASLSRTLAPVGIASSEAPGTSAVTPGAVSVTSTGIPTSAQIGLSATSIGAVTLTATGIPSSEAAGVSVVTPGAVSIASTGIPTAEQVGASSASLRVAPAGIPTSEVSGRSSLAVSLSGTGIASSETPGISALTVGAVSIASRGIESSERSGVSSIGAAPPQTITATGIPSVESIGKPTISVGPATLSATGIPSSEQAGVAAVQPGAVPVVSRGIPSEERFGASLVVIGAYTINATGIPSVEQFGTATITPGGVMVSPAGIPPSEALGVAGVGFVIRSSGQAPSEWLGASSVEPSGIAKLPALVLLVQPRRRDFVVEGRIRLLTTPARTRDLVVQVR